MGVLIYSSIRIYKQDRASFTPNECGSLKAFLFDSPYYHSSGFTFYSRFTPVIFELADEGHCIEAQFDRYNDLHVMRNLEWLYEMTFPAYDFWFIFTYDSSSPLQDTDQAGHFKYLKPGASDHPDATVDLRVCPYRYDRIRLTLMPGTHTVPGELAAIQWQASAGGFESLDHAGTYTSNNTKLLGATEGAAFSPEAGSGLIALEHKYDLKKGGASYLWVMGETYSHGALDTFIKQHRTTSNVLKMDFFYKGRHVRRLRRNRHDEVLCLDGWDNCADEAFLDYLSERST